MREEIILLPDGGRLIRTFDANGRLIGESIQGRIDPTPAVSLLTIGLILYSIFLTLLYVFHKL